MFANRFACGSSVAKNNQGQDEIVVQGDFSEDVLKMILTNWTNVSALFFWACVLCVCIDANTQFDRFLRKTLTKLKKRRRRRLKHKFSFVLN